jgi:5'/3'-nucleotidase SurE
VLLSGTIGAALHGFRNGVTSVALSLHHVDEGSDPVIKGLTAQVVEEVVTAKETSLLNVNFPLLDPGACQMHNHPATSIGTRGAKNAILAPPRMADNIARDSRTNRTFFWNNRTAIDLENDTMSDDCDLALLRDGMVTVTQLTDSLGESEPSAETQSLISNLDARIRSA